MSVGRWIASSLPACAGLLLALSASPALAQEEDFCRTYAYEALEAAQQHIDNQCGGDLTGYSLKLEDHYNVCMYWGPEAMKYATQSTNTRAQAFYNCEAEKAGVAAIDLGHTEYENDYPRPGDKFGFCSNYAFWATTQRSVAIQQNCGFSEESGRWAESFNEHRDWCMGIDFYEAGAFAEEINDRTRELVQCQLIVDDLDPTGKTAGECVAANSRCENRMQAYGTQAPLQIAAQCTPIYQVCMGLVQGANAQLEADMNPLGKTPEECMAANNRCANRMLAYGTTQAELQTNAQCTPIYQMCIADAASRGGGGGGGGEGTINADVTGYEFWDGATDKCYLGDGDKATLLETKPDDPNWKHLQGVGETCDGEDFYLYDNGELDGL